MTKASADRTEIRPREAVLTLPRAADEQVYFIGRIRTPLIDLKPDVCPNAGTKPA